VGTLAPEIAGLGLAVAITSPGSVVTVIALLSMSNGVRRAIAFICGWVLAIGLLAVLVIFVLHGQDFGSRHTTPSRTASAIEVVLGLLLLVGSFRAYRRPRQQTKSQSPPKWLDRIDRTHWALGLAVGAFMLSFALTVAAMAEILKAHVGVLDAAVACLVFALTSIVTIAAPVVVVLVAPDRSAQVLATWKTWLLQHARSIALILLIVIGVLLIVRGVYDLTA
jgi:threonine/homoserine/homoserine lactone efflux protein